MARGVALFCVAFHTMKRGFEPACTLLTKSLFLPLPDFGELSFSFQFGKTLWKSSQAVVVPSGMECPESCAIRPLEDKRQMPVPGGGGGGWRVPSSVTDGATEYRLPPDEPAACMVRGQAVHDALFSGGRGSEPLIACRYGGRRTADIRRLGESSKNVAHRQVGTAMRTCRPAWSRALG